jgi:hypothetical protein
VAWASGPSFFIYFWIAGACFRFLKSKDACTEKAAVSRINPKRELLMASEFHSGPAISR